MHPSSGTNGPESPITVSCVCVLYLLLLPLPAFSSSQLWPTLCVRVCLLRDSCRPINLHSEEMRDAGGCHSQTHTTPRTDDRCMRTSNTRNIGVIHLFCSPFVFLSLPSVSACVELFLVVVPSGLGCWSVIRSKAHSDK